jgi:hypothetical protein
VYRGLPIEEARSQYEKIIETMPIIKKTRKLKGKK